MGWLPGYDFIARLSAALGHAPGISLYGDYMAVVPLEKQAFVKELARKENVSTNKFVQTFLEEALEAKVNSAEKFCKKGAKDIEVS